MRVIVDLDSGTVVNGPVYAVNVDENELEAMQSNDTAARCMALSFGRRLS